MAVNTAGVFGGALPPLIAGTLQATYGSWAVGPMLAILALASFVCTYLLPETKGGRRWESTPGGRGVSRQADLTASAVRQGSTTVGD